jgi:hypothetical protein
MQQTRNWSPLLVLNATTISTIIPMPQGRINPVADGEMNMLRTAIDVILTNSQLAPNAPFNKNNYSHALRNDHAGGRWLDENSMDSSQ